MLRLRRMLIIALATFGTCYLALCIAVFALQRSLLYPAPKGTPPLSTIKDFSRLPLSGGLYVDLFYLPAFPGAPTVVHFHGNGEEVLTQVGLGSLMEERGLGFLAVEYPGYGASPGKPTEEGIYEAAEAALRWLREQGVTVQQTVLSGRSLGTGVAVEMARRGHGARVMLVSPYTSIPDIGASAFPYLPVGLLARDRYDTASKAASVTLPVLIIHGEEDDLIPVAMGRKLGTLFPHAVVETVAGAGHNDVLEDLAKVYKHRMASFALGEP
ncbi:hydrolase of the alpha/beta superfamily [Myxococcus hansupus]|uniref:Hydrolase of the alpha/beta superfamily n=1 Tax=Pseudomyxococcus hansupus TaxID=1297742 RepID=A0A0H4X6X1_9BACT|nr:alpha/beta hydrolase [Myxococcus hansupus]AKQ63602.1 hydrolase of the alpha/beta superfamily [Myxococcus hansupus]